MTRCCNVIKYSAIGLWVFWYGIMNLYAHVYNKTVYTARDANAKRTHRDYVMNAEGNWQRLFRNKEYDFKHTIDYKRLKDFLVMCIPIWYFFRVSIYKVSAGMFLDHYVEYLNWSKEQIVPNAKVGTRVRFSLLCDHTTEGFQARRYLSGYRKIEEFFTKHIRKNNIQ